MSNQTDMMVTDCWLQICVVESKDSDRLKRNGVITIQDSDEKVMLGFVIVAILLCHK